MTAEEQLLQVRTEYVKNLYKGQPEEIIKKATRHLHIMNFDSVEDFEAYAKDQFQNDPNREATEEELDNIFSYMGMSSPAKDTRSAEEKEMDEIFKHI